VVTGHLVASVWSQGIWTRGHLVAWSFSRVVVRSHGYVVAGHLVAGHLVAGHFFSLCIFLKVCQNRFFI
jgi:hypothetical protein